RQPEPAGHQYHDDKRGTAPGLQPALRTAAAGSGGPAAAGQSASLNLLAGLGGRVPVGFIDPGGHARLAPTGCPWRPARRAERLNAPRDSPRRQVGLRVGAVVKSVEHLPASLARRVRGSGPPLTTRVPRLARRIALLSHGAPP